MRRETFRVSGAILLATVAAASARAEAPASDARAAIGRSLDFLEREGFAWMEGRVPIQNGAPCVSCHQVPYAVWSLEEARRHGIAAEDTRVGELRRSAVAFVTPDECRAASCAPLLMSGERNDGASAMARQLVDQRAEDHWRARGQFPTQRRPIEETDQITTMWTVLTLDAGEDELQDSREAAERWVRREPEGESTEWILARMLVEHRARDRAAATDLERRLLARQNPDGGWPFLADQASDALSTGQAIYALAIAGDPAATREALRKGVSWLVGAQGEDGTWKADSKLFSTKPSPGKDYVYTYWGTAWAVLGLARGLDP